MVVVNNNYIIDSDPQDHVLMNCGMKIIRKKYSKCDCMGGRLWLRRTSGLRHHIRWLTDGGSIPVVYPMNLPQCECVSVSLKRVNEGCCKKKCFEYSNWIQKYYISTSLFVSKVDLNSSCSINTTPHIKAKYQLTETHSLASYWKGAERWSEPEQKVITVKCEDRALYGSSEKKTSPYFLHSSPLFLVCLPYSVVPSFLPSSPGSALISLIASSAHCLWYACTTCQQQQ